MAKQVEEIYSESNILTPLCRISYPNLATPHTKGKYADEKYKADILISKKENIKSLQDEVSRLMKERFPKLDAELLVNPIKDGDLSAAEHPERAGHWLIRAKNSSKPTLYDRNKQLISGDEFYGGCYAKMLLKAGTYQGNSSGVTFFLNGAMFWRDGDKFGSGSVDADEFGSTEPEVGDKVDDKDFD